MPAGIGGTVADLLDAMSILDNELDLSAATADESRAFKALTAAQHYFETIAASLPRVLQSTITVVTAASTETTTWTSSLLRLDALWFLDPTTSRPTRRLKRISEVGGHVPALPWPLDLALPSGTGAPSGYYANMANFYWLPLPDGVNTLRVYGFVEQAEFTASGDAFNYPKRCKIAFANFAVQLLNLGVGDSVQDLDALAAKVFGPLLRQMRKFDRSEPQPRYYNEAHVT